LCDVQTTRCVPIVTTAARDGGFTKMVGEVRWLERSA
jgi:hypothetical protein